MARPFGLITAILLAILVTHSARTAETQLVLSGRPSSKVESSPGATARSLLSPAQAEEFAVKIVKRGERYYWASRENRELSRSTSGAYHYFVAGEGGGYVKVEDQQLLPESLREPGPRFRYTEHMGLGLGTITYWGSAESFSP